MHPSGLKLFGEKYKGLQDIRYANGPVMDVNISSNLPPVEVLAWFRTEIANPGTPAGIQVNSPAIVMTTYGKGTMLVISPHPETTPALRELMVEMIRFVARRAGTGPPMSLHGKNSPDGLPQGARHSIE